MCLYPALVQSDEIAPTVARILGILEGPLRISNVTEVILIALSVRCGLLLIVRYCRSARCCDAGTGIPSRSQGRPSDGLGSRVAAILAKQQAGFAAQ
jgi:hypothetical protein